MRNLIGRWLMAGSISAMSFVSAVEPTAIENPVVIIGGGVGALTSAIYLARAGMKTVVIEGRNPGGALAQSPSVQNWPGEFDISGYDLMEKIHQQAERNGVVFLQSEVVGVDFSTHPFSIKTKSIVDPSQEERFSAAACIVATGSEPSRLRLAAEQKYWLKGVYPCAVCDGALFKGKTVAVVGGGDAALVEAEYLSQLASKVYVVVRKYELKGNEKMRLEALKNTGRVEFIWGAQVEDLRGDDNTLSEIVMRQEGKRKNLHVDALFLAIGSKPSSELFKGQLAMDDHGFITVKEDGATSVPGVYAIGDVVDPIYKQAISAAGDGAKAALSSQQFVIGAKMARSSLASHEKVKAVENPTFSSKVIEVKNADQFNKEVSTSQIPVVVDFYASWCGPCRHIAPILDSYAQQLQGKVKIVKVNVNECSDLADAYQVRAMPTLITLDAAGKVLDRRSGTTEILQYLKSIK